MNDPPWVTEARHCYSRIGPERTDPVTVFRVEANVEVSEEKPGTECLHLRPASRSVVVLSAAGREEGVIRAERILPIRRYVMRRNGNRVWALSNRSFVHKRHVLDPGDGETWTFDTPFFWWQHLTGSIGGVPKLLGYVGPSKRFWLMWIEPGRDTDDLLAAVALMHRNWWRL